MGSLKANISIINSTVSGSGSSAIGIVGASSAGPLGLTVAGTLDDLAEFGAGPLVTVAEAAIRSGARVALFRESTPVKSYGTAPTVTPGGGTIVGGDVTYDATQKPHDRAFLSVRFVTGGTTGTAGITYQVSRKYNPTESDYEPTIYSLGTALFIQSIDGIKILLVTGKTVTTTTRILNAEGLLPTVLDATITNALAAMAVTETQIYEAAIAANVTTGQLALISAALDLMKAKGRQPTVFVQVAESLIGQDRTTFLAAASAVVTGVVDSRICAFSTEAEFASLVSGRSQCMYPALVSAVAMLGRLSPASDFRAVALPPSNAEESVSVTDEVAGNTVQSLIVSTTQVPLGAWDDSTNDALSDLRIGALRRVPQRQGTYISTAPTLAQTGTAISQAAHARVVSRAFANAFFVMYTVLGQNYPTYPKGDPKEGQVFPYVADRINAVITDYLRTALSGMVNGVRFVLDETDSISDAHGSGVIYLDLFNTIEEISVPIVAQR